MLLATLTFLARRVALPKIFTYTYPVVDVSYLVAHNHFRAGNKKLAVICSAKAGVNPFPYRDVTGHVTTALSCAF